MNDPLSVMDLRYLDGTWFHTWRWPGLLLFLLVGVGPAFVIVATLMRFPLAVVAHACVCAGLLAWIPVQTSGSSSLRCFR